LSALFEDLIGQPLAVDLLSAALAQGRVAPAYLFAGPEGVGRQLAAVRFLEGLLADGQPSARERRRLLERNHPDLLWVEPTYQHQGRLLTRAEAEEAGLSRRTPPQLRLEQIRDIGRCLARQPVEAKRGMVVIEAAEAMGSCGQCPVENAGGTRPWGADPVDLSPRAVAQHNSLPLSVDPFPSA